MVFMTVLFAIAGLLIGSFLNVCIVRIPLGKSIAYPPSSCGACGHRLHPMDLVPVLSFLFLRGRCRYCGEKISWQYPAVEALTALLFVVLFWQMQLTTALYIMLALVSLLMVAAVIDIRHQIIPDEIVIGIAIVGAVYILLELPNWLSHVIGIFAGALPLLVIALFAQYALKKEGMGGGDIKLMAACGLVIGWKLILTAFIWGTILGALAAIPLLLLKKIKMQGMLPFGPFLAAGVTLSGLYGNAFLTWYLSFFG